MNEYVQLREFDYNYIADYKNRQGEEYSRAFKAENDTDAGIKAENMREKDETLTAVGILKKDQAASS